MLGWKLTHESFQHELLHLDWQFVKQKNYRYTQVVEFVDNLILFFFYKKGLTLFRVIEQILHSIKKIFLRDISIHLFYFFQKESFLSLYI